MDPIYLSVLVSAEKKFWRCVQSGEPPHLINAEPPRPRIEAIRIVDMSSSNSWSEFAALFQTTRDAFLDHERAKSELKALMPEDAKEAIGHGVRARRSKRARWASMFWRRKRAMPRSSELVAALAAALAKAQAELVNPEKSLTAIIRAGRPGESERNFLLCLARKWARHRAQESRPACDRHAGDHRHRCDGWDGQFDATLAHASGEWVASDWPVCPIGETASPQRMGAALTYARRYALFTLVGIAGEDDFDAPDVCDGARSPTPSAVERSLKPSDGQLRVPPRKPGNGQRRHGMHGERPSTLASEQSSTLREQLLTALGNVTSSDGATIWAQEALAAKNRLASTDAKLVEDAFEQRLSKLAPTATEEAPADAALTPYAGIVGAHETAAKGNSDRDQPDRIDKSMLAIATPRRYRSREHLRYVSKQACLICGRKQSDPHHLRFLQPRALGRKVKATNPPSRSVARITARFIAPATNRPGGGRRASIPSELRVCSGDERGTIIRKVVTKRLHRGLDQMPRHRTARGKRAPTGPMTVELREQHGFAARCRNGCTALSRERRHRLCRPRHRRSPWNLAPSQQALSGLVAPAILRAHLGCAEPCRAEHSPRCAAGTGSIRWTTTQGLDPRRRAGRPDLPRSGG